MRTAAARWTAVFLMAGVPAVLSAAGRGEQRSLADKLRWGPGASNHPVHVVPSSDVEIPPGWPLDDDGTITCLTCHAALPSYDGATGPRLRGFDARVEDTTAFCTNCHVDQNRRSAAAMHWMAVRTAHVNYGRDRAKRTRSLLDTDTRRCLGCHDGVSATESQNRTAWNPGRSDMGNQTQNHPVGVRYSRGSLRRGGTPLRPASALPREIRLPGGMVSCVSCHDLYARDRHLLTVPLDGSELCFTCHQMD